MLLFFINGAPSPNRSVCTPLLGGQIEFHSGIICQPLLFFSNKSDYCAGKSDENAESALKELFPRANPPISVSHCLFPNGINILAHYTGRLDSEKNVRVCEICNHAAQAMRAAVELICKTQRVCSDI